MRLLNLWPDAPRSKRSGVMRLWQESIFALLLTGLLLAAAYVFLSGRVQQAREVNQTLQTHLAQLQTTSAGVDDDSQYLDWRSQHAGQLNWLAALPQLTDAHSQLTQVVQKKEGIQISGRADSASDAQRLIARVNQVFVKPELVVQSLEGKADGWYFVLQTRLNASVDNQL